MFSRPLFRSSLWSDPFFEQDTLMDEWNDLLRQQWNEQQAFKQQRGAQQQPSQQRIQQKQQDNKCCPTTNNACTTTGNCNSNNTCNNNQQMVSQPSSTSTGTIGRPRSFWDLTSFPSWSGLTPQSIRLEWSGTESSAKEYIVSAYLPDQMTIADVKIEMDERTHMLTLKCQTKSHEEEKDSDGHIISSRSSSSHVERSLRIPSDVDMSGIVASKGTTTTTTSSTGSSPQLVLHLPKLATPQQQPGVKQITIRQ